MNAISSSGQEIRDYYFQAYENTDPSEQQWTTATAAPELVELVRSGALPQGGSVLDIGCGVGSESVYLAGAGFDVTAVDIAPRAVERGRALAEVYGYTVDWHVADVLELPFEDRQFDAVTDRGCFHCLRAPERARFAEGIARVLRPNGLYVLRCVSSQRLGQLEADAASHFVRTFGVSSTDLWEAFGSQFQVEHMELGSAAPDKDAATPYGWYCLWRRRAE
ncbi:class I SAM-dependent methyltransferase [Streptomyces sp. BHT-5-2]|uniref:class I SAM-dependent methyltransferase n=1 Tax=Streptomyces sp. BHT-5-2 TaxID=2866715 RepID=UPI001C8D231F|nr:class I SAM-dependent methyltransferase [Streptomyces sp. BHT-5-2]QZL06407.1 class I SAM-dependent methyltransferase [Streptomyces sp. BHT-5-2]